MAQFGLSDHSRMFSSQLHLFDLICKFVPQGYTSVFIRELNPTIATGWTVNHDSDRQLWSAVVTCFKTLTKHCDALVQAL